MIEDVGYLSNKRMALEVGVGLAHLSGRVLSLPIDAPIGWGPRPTLDAPAAGRPSSLRDLYDLPVPVMGDEEYAALITEHPIRSVDWPDLHTAVFVDPPALQFAGDFAEFAIGRPAVTFDPGWVDAPILDVPARALGFYSYLFFLEADRRRELFALLEQIRLKQPYVQLARDLAAHLGPFNSAHIRRTDHLVGVPQYRAVSPWLIRDNLASVFPAEERLVVCTEADPESDVFVPLRSHFRDVVFLTQVVLGESPWRERFAALPCHDDSALAVLTQELAVGAERFAGTFASTFTAIIHRSRRLRDPTDPFLFTADFLGGETRFEACQYLPVSAGRYSWNRLGYPVGADALAWMREWPEVVAPQ
jgi:hypothetical protein